MSLVVRAAAPAEWEALADLWVDAWRSTPIERDFASHRPWLLEHLAQIAQAGAWIAAARRGGEPVGFITCQPATGYLDQLAVRPADQGAGVAKALLDHAKAARPKGLSLKVNVDNPRAVAFYRREGFAVTGEGVSERSGLKLLDMEWRG